MEEDAFMLRKYNNQTGFTLLEMLVAFSALIMLTAVIVPLYIQAIQAEKDKKRMYVGDALLYEKVMTDADQKHLLSEKRMYNGVEYLLVFKEEPVPKWCVSWKRTNQKIIERCESTLK